MLLIHDLRERQNKRVVRQTSRSFPVSIEKAPRVFLLLTPNAIVFALTCYVVDCESVLMLKVARLKPGFY